MNTKTTNLTVQDLMDWLSGSIAAAKELYPKLDPAKVPVISVRADPLASVELEFPNKNPDSGLPVLRNADDSPHMLMIFVSEYEAMEDLGEIDLEGLRLQALTTLEEITAVTKLQMGLDDHLTGYDDVQRGPGGELWVKTWLRLPEARLDSVDRL